MIPELGHFCLAMAVVLACAQGVIGIASPTLKDPRALQATSLLSLSQGVAVFLAFASLVWASVVSDFTVADIANFSSASLPIFYRITGVWGNQDGSILLWCLILSGCGACVALARGNLPSLLRACVLGVMGFISCGFLLFTLVVSNPFSRIWPPPLQGMGLNPLLQEPGLALHPPILYAGYVGFSVAFAFGVAALIEGRVDAVWANRVRPWVLLAWCFLTAGITLGSWWSYGTLGWGGFWFWDPVENAALLPWLTGTALLHCVMVVEKRESLKIWAVFLAIATFSLSLTGTFLTRSGLLASVHSFTAAPGQGLFLLVLLGIAIGGALLLFAIRAPSLGGSNLYMPISRESALILNNIFLCAIAAVVLTGTLYPLFANLLAGVQLSIGAPFFNQTVLPMAVPVILTMGIGPLLPWKRADLGPVLQRLWLAGSVALLLFLIVAATTSLIAALGIAAGAWVILAALTDIAGRIRRLRRLPLTNLGGALAHLGFGVVIIGIASMSLAVRETVVLKPGESTLLGGYTWTLDDIRSAHGPNYTQRIADIEVSQNGNVRLHLSPAIRFFANDQTISQAAIHSDFKQDLYAVFVSESDGAAALRLNRNPGALEIWLGGLVMVMGGFCALFSNRWRNVLLARKKRPSGQVS